MLDPLVEIAADVIHPKWQLSMAELQRRLTVRPFPLVLLGGGTELRPRVCEELGSEFPDIAVTQCPPGDDPLHVGGIIVRLGDVERVLATCPQLDLRAVAMNLLRFFATFWLRRLMCRFGG